MRSSSVFVQGRQPRSLRDETVQHEHDRLGRYAPYIELGGVVADESCCGPSSGLLPRDRATPSPLFVIRSYTNGRPHDAAPGRQSPFASRMTHSLTSARIWFSGLSLCGVRARLRSLCSRGAPAETETARDLDMNTELIWGLRWLCVLQCPEPMLYATPRQPRPRQHCTTYM